MQRKYLPIMVSLALVAGLLGVVPAPRALAATCNSTKTGNWSDTTVWSCAAVPGASDDVYIQSGHIITLTQNQSVRDLNLNNTTAQRLVTGAFTLSVYGKLRAYSGAAPGTDGSPPASGSWIDTSAGGKISIVGSSRSNPSCDPEKMRIVN